MELKNVVFVLANDGTKLMPTSPYRARKLLSKKKAKVYKYKPFTIILTYDSEKNTQPIELCQDTGDKHIGVSLKSDKKEFIHAEFDNLSGEKENHDDCRKYRRERRSHKRYRPMRINNRKRDDGWIAPSLENKKNNHINIIKKITNFCPVTDIYIEVGSFDTQKLEALEKGLPLPEGKDYQNGPKKNFETLRQAVFYRDNYTCQICGKSISDNAILQVHHIGFWRDDHTDRMGNLLTVCTKCHTAKNHKPGGKLYGLEPKLKPLTGEAFMNTIRWKITGELKDLFSDINIHTVYGSDTRIARSELELKKTHANDAYAMGVFHPNKMSDELLFQKLRRNNRKLQKFYDAKYKDIRDGKTKKASELGSNRTNRREPRNSEKNERHFRGDKLSKGHISVRKQRYPYQPGDTILFQGSKYTVKGCTHYGQYVSLKEDIKDLPTKLIKKHTNRGGWALLTT